MESIYGKKGVVLPAILAVPQIDDEELAYMYKLLKPIVNVEGAKYLLKEYTLAELRNQSYLWNASEDKREKVDSEKLKVIQEFLCLHTFGYPTLFKPSIAEVLSQMPMISTMDADYFEIVESPKDQYDVFRYKDLADKHLHLSMVRTYSINGR